ncbi:MAG: glycosyltransferase family 39 protein [Candidatus Pacebacteria bacterium]|nr:glycosyltransferase family 39 protein [Candidatus Paceibacterota bacterium]
MEYLNKNKKILIVIFLTILSFSLSLLFIKIIPALPVISDSKDYSDIATSIITDSTYISISEDLILYPPLYPIFLSIIYKITHIGFYPGVYFVQNILVFGISILVFLTLKTRFKISTKLALFSSLVVFLWPYFILYSQLISSEVLYSFLLSLSVFLFLKINNESNKNITVITGILFGLAILTRPVALLLIPWILIGLFIVSKSTKFFGEFSIPWKKYFLVLIIATITIMPWEIYVKTKYDRIIPVASNLSFVFNKANKTLSYLPSENTGREENAFSNLLKAKARNIYLFWDPGASGYHLDILKEKYPKAVYVVFLYKIVFFAILATALLATVLYRREKIVILLTIIILYFWAVHTVLFPFPRYTLPIIPFVIILATIGISRLSNHFYARKK